MQPKMIDTILYTSNVRIVLQNTTIVQVAIDVEFE